jgi:hypothetical protein
MGLEGTHQTPLAGLKGLSSGEGQLHVIRWIASMSDVHYFLTAK